MKFRTEINPAPAGFTLSHTDRILVLGSCFAENISERMIRAGLSLVVNPSGTVYNPASAADCLHDLIRRKTYTEDDLLLWEGLYHSLSHHSRFSGSDSPTVLERINTSIARAADLLPQAALLIITFGTAHTYRLARTGQTVSNCHKLPSREFHEHRLTVDQITAHWTPLIRELQNLHPHLHILFTVSPVRHRKPDAHANQLSKATLLLAVDQLIHTHPHCHYFPAYEIMLDDLRDYRFYADDLVHPNTQAVDYLWEKFTATYFDPSTQALAREHEKEYRRTHHVPIIMP
jgi:hypothetical protein